MSAPVVIYPDIEALVVEHLTDELPNYYDGIFEIGSRKPSPMPTGRGVIQIRRVGGIPETPVSDVARVDVLVWHDTDEQAHDLMAVVRALMYVLRGHTNPNVYRVNEFLGPTRYADPDSDQPRWLLTDEIAVRGQPLEPLIGS